MVPSANESWLPVESFPEVVPIRHKADVKFLELLGVRHLDVGVIKHRIVTGSDLTIDQRVALIIGLSKQESLRGAYTSALFLDSSGCSLSDGMRVFLASSTGEVPRLPEWADLRILNEDIQ